jgi:drug/metabolite transporter (DMT)-like permease
LAPEAVIAALHSRRPLAAAIVEPTMSSTVTADGARSERSHRLRNQLAGFAWAATAVSIFSGWFVVTRIGVTHHLRAWDVIAIRFVIGTLCLLPVLVVQRRLLSRRAWGEGLVFALLWGAPFVVFVTLGLQLTSAAQAASVTPALMPVISGTLAWVLLRESPGPYRLLGYIAIVAGQMTYVIANVPSVGWPSTSGIACLVAAATLWGIYTLRFRRSTLPPLLAAALICVWSVALYLPAYFWLDLSRLGTATVREIGFQAFYQGVLMSVVATVAYNRAVALVGSGAASAVMAMVPVMAALLAIPFLGEYPSAIAAIAIGVIALGVFLASRVAPSQRIVAKNT